MIEVELPDGTILEFPEGTSPTVMKSAAAKYHQSRQQSTHDAAPQSPRAEYPYPDMTDTEKSYVDDYGHGLAATQGATLGTIDNVMSGIEAVGAGVGAAARLENPIDAAGERYNRSQTIRKAGRDQFREEQGPLAILPEFLGGMATGGLAGGLVKAPASATRLGMGARVGGVGAAEGALEGFASADGGAFQDRMKAAGVGAGIGAATGGLLGGMFPGRRPQAPSMDELRQRQAAAYDTVDQMPVQLTPAARTDLVSRVQERGAGDAIDDVMHPKAARASERAELLSERPLVSEIEKYRRLTGEVAGSPDASEARRGAGLKQEITDYLNDLSPRQVGTGSLSNLEAVKNAISEGRDMTQRIKKSEMVTDGPFSASEKAMRRAMTSGTGGNEVNAIRQNVRAILDNPKKMRGFSAEERKAMEELVSGTPTINAMRLLGRLSPTSGALPLAGGGALMAGAGATSNPLFLVPPIVGLTAKAGAEAATKGKIAELSELLRNGGQIGGRNMSPTQRAAIVSILTGANASAGQQYHP